VQSSLQRMFHQRSKAYYTPGLGPDLGTEGKLLELTDWFVSAGCGAHDIQKSLKWAMSRFAGADALHDLHIIVESLRNSFALLHGQLRPFLLTHLAFDDTPYNMGDVMEFWQALGVEADMLQEIAEVNPWWVQGQLHVNANLQRRTNMMEKVSAVVLYMFRWRKFVDTRFCAIGPSMRAVLCSLCVGLQQLVQMTRADAHSTDYHLHGFARLCLSLKVYMVIASVASWVPDGLLFEVLEDERLVLRAAELQSVLLDELRCFPKLSVIFHLCGSCVDIFCRCFWSCFVYIILVCCF
jgi:hypothetical protein